ncbi:MAG TPA: hypothetical protein VF766_05255, partial [Pyrinomonadaceae bacterium]
MRRRPFAVALLLLCAMMFSSLPLRAQQPAPAQDANDPIARIKDEGMNRSQVMQTLSYLTDVIGPRLTNSPNMKRANEWTRDKLTEWGLENSHLEAWGPFGRGWALKDFSAVVVAPQAIPLIAYPKAWSPGVELTNAEVVYLDAKDENDLQRFKGKLRGKIVLTSSMKEVKAHFEAPGKRHTEKQLLALADAPAPGEAGGAPDFTNSPNFQDFMKSQIFVAKKFQFVSDEGAALIIDTSPGDGGTLFVSAATVPQPLDTSSPMATMRSMFLGNVQPYDKTPPKIVPQVVLSIEHYNRLMRLIQAGEKVQMNVRLVTQFYDQDLMAYNTVAEIPGTDLKDEI